MKYFAKIKYLGTDFCGFQVQPDGTRTVQGELTRALSELFGERVRVTGCSRTDSKVHANEFCISIECETATIPADKLPLAAARFLPQDISLYFAKECDYDFHPRYDVKSKEYVYKIKNSPVSDPFLINRVMFLSQPILPSHIERMREAAKYIVGRHDFRAFMAKGSCVTDTVREVYYLRIDKSEDLITVSISANGFLYNMVRIIVGTLLDVAFGRIEPQEVADIILSADRSRAGTTVVPEGLYLNRVIY